MNTQPNTCNNCGNFYKKCMTITLNNQSYTFDSFECAINYLAPVCNTCKSRIIGHGVQENEVYYCCAHCARENGIKGIKDHV